MFCGLIATAGKKLFKLPNPDVPTKKALVKVTFLAADPDAITALCSVLDFKVAT